MRSICACMHKVAMREDRVDWESLKFFLAVAREGSLAGAGRVLGVKHSTVLRRIAQLEEELGIALFERHPNGYRLTPAGREALETAGPVEEQLVAMERTLSGRDLRLTGVVRLTTIGALVPWVAEALAGFRILHPGITTDVTISPAPASLARHEADIAVRVSQAPPDTLVGRRIASLAHAVYCAEGHPAAGRPDVDFASQPWIGYSSAREQMPQAAWLAATVPDDRVIMRTGHTGMMVAAAVAGLGLAVLPCYLGDAEPHLARVRALPFLGQDLWILTHRDLKRTPRVRTVMEYLTKALLRHRDLIEGRHGGAGAPPLVWTGQEQVP